MRKNVIAWLRINDVKSKLSLLNRWHLLISKNVKFMLFSARMSREERGGGHSFLNEPEMRKNVIAWLRINDVNAFLHPYNYFGATIAINENIFRIIFSKNIIVLHFLS